MSDRMDDWVKQVLLVDPRGDAPVTLLRTIIVLTATCAVVIHPSGHIEVGPREDGAVGGRFRPRRDE